MEMGLVVIDKLKISCKYINNMERGKPVIAERTRRYIEKRVSEVIKEHTTHFQKRFGETLRSEDFLRENAQPLLVDLFSNQLPRFITEIKAQTGRPPSNEDLGDIVADDIRELFAALLQNPGAVEQFCRKHASDAGE